MQRQHVSVNNCVTARVMLEEVLLHRSWNVRPLHGRVDGVALRTQKGVHKAQPASLTPKIPGQYHPYSCLPF
jgi:hypothetical protein